MKDKQKDVVTFNYFDWAAPSNCQKYRIYARKTPTENSKMHKHAFIEFFFVTNGQAYHLINGQEVMVKKGDAALLTRDDVHGFRLDGNQVFEHTDVLIETDFFIEACNFFYNGLYDSILSVNGAKSFVLTYEQISDLVSCSSYLFLPSDNISHMVMAKSILSKIISLFLKNYYLSEHANSYPDWIMSLITKFSDVNNFSLSASDIVKEFAYNPDYIRRLFKRYTGTTMLDFFNKKKVEQAYLLLRTTDMSIEQVCTAVGIANPSHFYHLFKKIYHTTPSSVKQK